MAVLRLCPDFAWEAGSTLEDVDCLLHATRQIFPQLIDPETTDSPTKTLKLQVSPVIVILAATSCGPMNRLTIDLNV
jgi:hypothetical protein